MDDAELVSQFTEDLNKNVRDPARKYTASALSTLNSLMKNTKTPPNVRRTCAMNILDQGWGRPDAREDTGGQRDQGGLTINVLRLYDGAQRTIGVGGVQADVKEAIEIAASVDAMKVETPQDVERRSETE